MSALRLINVIVAVLMIVYALIAHLALAGIPFALLIIGGLLLIWSGVGRKLL